MSLLKVISIVACVLLAVGFMYRRKRRVHIPLMLSAFVVDMGLVLYIELSRGAIDTARTTTSGLMIFHIAISVGVVLLYFWQIYTGIRRVRGAAASSHGATGLTLLVLRLGNLVTSFMVA